MKSQQRPRCCIQDRSMPSPPWARRSCGLGIIVEWNRCAERKMHGAERSRDGALCVRMETETPLVGA